MTKISIGIVIGGGGGGAEGMPATNDVYISQLAPENPCKLEYPINPCGYSVAGINRILFARRSEIEEYFFHSYDNRNLIKSIKPKGSGVTWVEWQVVRDAMRFSEEQANTESGPVFLQKIDFAYAPISWQHRRALRPLVGVAGHVVLFQDKNARWWLAGETKGMKIATRTSQTGDANGRNNIEFSISCAELHPIREVLASVAEAILAAPATAAAGGQISTLSGVIVTNFAGIKIEEL